MDTRDYDYTADCRICKTLKRCRNFALLDEDRINKAELWVCKECVQEIAPPCFWIFPVDKPKDSP